MYLANQQARPVGYAQKKTAGRAEPQDPRLVDDDRLGPVAVRVPRSSMSRRSGSAPMYEWHGGRAAISTGSRWRTSAIPLMVGFYVISMVVVGSHLWHGVASAFQSLGARRIRAGRRCILPAGKLLAVAHRRRLHRHRALGALRGRQSCAYEARCEGSRRPDRARSGTGTSSR